MKRHLFLASLLVFMGWQTGMADIGKPLVDLEFNESGIVNKGSDQTHTCTAYDKKTYKPMQVYDETRATWLGCTDKDPRNYYYCTFDADDALGKAFKEGDATWELLFRVEDLESYQVLSTQNDDKKTKVTLAYSRSLGNIKILGCTQGGGWSFRHYPSTEGLTFEYYDGNAKKYVSANTKNKLNSLATGQFYHLVATLNKSDNTLKVWINGQNVISKANFKVAAADTMGFPAIGDTKNRKNMWFCLGGDPGTYINGYKYNEKTKKYDPTNSTADKPDACENSCRTTWVYAKIYGHALTDAEAESLYDAEAKAFTEPAQP